MAGGVTQPHSHPGVESRQERFFFFFKEDFGQVWEGQGREGDVSSTRELGGWREVTNRWDGEAESQWIVAARLLYHLQYLVPYLSRLQRIHLPDRLKL